jgi:hypothetical protein
MKTFSLAALLAILTGAAWAASNSELEERIEALEERVAQLEQLVKPVAEEIDKEQIAAQQRQKARARMRKDLDVYSRDELREIEDLYQVANKQWRSEEGKESLKQLVAKYDKANRTGCALLYLGRMSKGDEQIEYLQQAIDGFSDCFYGDGVQVGAYARWCLAWRYKEDGEQAKARALLDEIKTQYPDAINHRGTLLREMMAAAEAGEK